MPEYIDREKVLKLLESAQAWNWSMNTLHGEIQALPAEDVALIVHGKNLTECNPVDEFICSHCGAIFRDVTLCEIDEDNGDETYYEFEFKYCPVCGMDFDLYACVKKLFNYCPNCGVKLDLEDD